MSRIMVMAAASALALTQIATAQSDNGSADAVQQEGIRADVRVEPDAEFVPGEILVGFHPGVGAAQADVARQGMAATHIREFPQIGVHLWRLPPGLTVDQAVGALSANRNVKYAEPNYIVRAFDTPNDPFYFHSQWPLNNWGYVGGTPDADIDAPEAWDIQTGSADVVVGVIDSGIDYTHPDLADNIWVNPGEVINGIDDDGNGYIDDVRGWDFVSNDNDPIDDHGHGTHVAGIIGARGNNGIAVTGVNWTVSLMPLKFLDSTGDGWTSDAIDAVLYAAGFGVRVTNNSWGGGRKSRALEDAIAASGALFVASAGNDGSSRKQYPAAHDLDNVISVAATDWEDELWSSSNYSDTWVHLGAPGVSVMSTVPTVNCTLCGGEYGVRNLSGTSMAAPHVAGVAALVMAEDPALNILAVKDSILSGVDPLPSLAGKTLTGGRLNAYVALTGSPPPPEPECGVPADCDDGDPCTIDDCVGEVCVNDSIDCDDADVCTVDSCSGGACFNDAIDCDDGDACTVDGCDPVNGCENIFPACGPADGCCGPGCDSGNDPDCTSCGAKNDSCTVDEDCCSGVCKNNGRCM